MGNLWLVSKIVLLVRITDTMLLRLLVGDKRAMFDVLIVEEVGVRGGEVENWGSWLSFFSRIPFFGGELGKKEVDEGSDIEMGEAVGGEERGGGEPAVAALALAEVRWLLLSICMLREREKLLGLGAKLGLRLVPEVGLELALKLELAMKLERVRMGSGWEEGGVAGGVVSDVTERLRTSRRRNDGCVRVSVVGCVRGLSAVGDGKEEARETEGSLLL
jgi:hypothetical protein